MKRVYIVLIILTISSISFGQKLTKKISKDICTCINDIEFDTLQEPLGKLQNCLGRMVYYAGDLKKEGIDIMIPSHLDSISEAITVYLMKHCEEFSKTLNLIDKDTSKNKAGSTIVDSTACRIMRNGKFKALDTEEQMITIMDGNKQTVEHPKDGYYTKSKVQWVSDCEYILTFIKSTNPNYNQLYKRGDKNFVKINKVEENIIYYHMNSKGLEYDGKLEKISDQ